MRRYESRRGSMVTDNADREGVESRNDRFGKGRWYQDASRQQRDIGYGENVAPTRDRRPLRA